MTSALVIDQLVRLDGLINEALNGAIGIVIRNQELDSTGRYSIQLKSPPSALISFPLPVKIQGKNLVIIYQCARPGCSEIANFKCSACNAESYCSAICQKNDWKIHHKKVCAQMKNSDQLLPFNKVIEIATEHINHFVKGKEAEKIRILQYSLSFTLFQFGDRVEGVAYRERLNGDRIDNWTAECCIFNTCFGLAKTLNRHVFNQLKSGEFKDSKILMMTVVPYAEKALTILEPWGIQLDLPKNEQTVTFDKYKIEFLVEMLSRTYCQLGDLHTTLDNFDQAAAHLEKAILYARRAGKDKTEILSVALSRQAARLSAQEKCEDATVYVEEAHEILAVLYSRDDPKFLRSAESLIDNYMDLENFYKCELFARVCYEELTRPIDTESLDVAEFALALGQALNGLFKKGAEGGNIEEAEMLIRKSIRISKKFYIANGILIINLCALSTTLALKKDLSEERRLLLQQILDIRLGRVEGAEIYVGYSQNNLGLYHLDVSKSLPTGNARAEHLNLALSYCKEAVRISTKISGPTHIETIRHRTTLSEVSELLLMR